MDALLKGFCQTLLTCRHKFYDGCPQQRKEDHTNGFHERSRFQWGSWEIKARGVQTYLLGLGYRESKVFSSLGFVLNTKTTLWQTPSLNLLVSNLAARPWMALWFLDGIFGCPTVAKLETFFESWLHVQMRDSPGCDLTYQVLVFLDRLFMAGLKLHGEDHRDVFTNPEDFLERMLRHEGQLGYTIWDYILHLLIDR